jgi:hypothetical protein
MINIQLFHKLFSYFSVTEPGNPVIPHTTTNQKPVSRMRYVYFLSLFLISVSSFSQESWDDFTGEERAFFYNYARKVEILKPELFHLFEFTDSIPWVNDTLPDYPYVEKKIVQYPEKLVLHTDEMARKPDGLVSDLATAYALWELDKVLHFRASVDEKDKPLKEKLKVFEHYVIENAPQSAITTLTSGEYVLMKGIPSYFAPSLSVTDKIAAVKNSGYPQNEQVLIVNAIMVAEEIYVARRSYEIFKILGGKCESYMNFLSAAGDGSSWSDLKGGFKTPYNVALPDDKGLYRFEAEEYIEKEETMDGGVVSKKPVIRIRDILVKELRMYPDKSTVLHFDVQGYHPERQTTIAIQKGGTSYILYGKNEHRLISPDSAYGTGTTYWRLLWELENVYIADLNEKLYGKKGYEYWIAIYEEKIKSTELLIKKTEFKLDELRHTPTGPPKMKKKKIKDKDLGNSDQINGHPTNKLTKHEKKTNIEQNRLIHLNTQLDGEKSTLAKLKKEMEEAYFLLIKYQALFDRMQKNLGYIFMDYEVEGNFYTFRDGATFNYATQDFTFPANGREEVFSVYHISFGEKVLSTQIEENFVHMYVSAVNPDQKFTYGRVVEDVNPMLALANEDSIQMMEIYRSILEQDYELEMKAIGGGIAGVYNRALFRDSVQTVEPHSTEGFRNTGVTVYRANKEGKLILSVKVWGEKTLPPDFVRYESAYAKFKSKNPDLNEVDFWTGIRARYAAEQWLKYLKATVPLWFKDAADQAILFKALNSIKVKTVLFLDGRAKSKVPELLM